MTKSYFSDHKWCIFLHQYGLFCTSVWWIKLLGWPLRLYWPLQIVVWFILFLLKSWKNSLLFLLRGADLEQLESLQKLDDNSQTEMQIRKHQTDCWHQGRFLVLLVSAAIKFCRVLRDECQKSSFDSEGFVHWLLKVSCIFKAGPAERHCGVPHVKPLGLKQRPAHLMLLSEKRTFV